MIWFIGRGFHIRLREHDDYKLLMVEGYTELCPVTFIGKERLKDGEWPVNIYNKRNGGEPHWRLVVERQLVEQAVVRHILTVWPDHLRKLSNPFDGIYKDGLAIEDALNSFHSSAREKPST